MLKSQNKNQDLHQFTISRAVVFLVRIILCCLLILTSGCSPTLLNSQSNNNSRLVLVSPSPPNTFNYAITVDANTNALMCGPVNFTANVNVIGVLNIV